MHSPGASNKPSWAFDIADGTPRSKSLPNYRIPYPRSPEDENTAKQQFVCARAFLVIVNILFFVVGFGSIITSIVAAAKPETCVLCHSILKPFLIFGFITSFIAVLGIYGALSDSYKVLLVYVTLMAFLFMVQMVCFFWTLFGRVNFQRRMHTVFRNKMRRQPGELLELLELVQQRLPCCGVDGPLDYHSAGLQLPLSCCSPGGGEQCGIRRLPDLSTTAAPQSNVTFTAENTTSSTTAANTTSSSTAASNAIAAAQAQMLPAELPPKAGETSTEAGKTPTEVHETSTEANKTSPGTGETSTEAGKTSPETKKISSKAGKTSTEVRETTTKAKETSTEAGKTSTEAGDTSIPSLETSPETDDTSTQSVETSPETDDTSTQSVETSPETDETLSEAGKASTAAEETWSEAEEISPEAEETWPEAEEISLKAGETWPEDEEISPEAEEISPEAGETWPEADEISPEAEETPAEAGAEPPSKVRRKRSVTAGATLGPNDVTTGPTEGAPGNGSQLRMNSTQLLMGNFSVNGTTEVPIALLLSNRTNLTGGPESWDIHHVKKRGCYPLLWTLEQRNQGWMVVGTITVAAVLSLQLVVLCTAHRVARGDFIQQG